MNTKVRLEEKQFFNVSVNIDTFIFIAAMKVHAQDVC